MKRILVGALILGSALLLPLPAHAQAPSITTVFPPGGQEGTTVSATVSGANLADLKAVFVSGAGVQVEKAAGGDASSCPLTVKIAADAEIGRREIRLVTSKGASNAGYLWVGAYPDLTEKEPNNSEQQAQLISKLPATVSGRAEKGEDLDWYSFDAGAGETWTFAINAAAHRSSMDGFLTLYDARGRVLHSALDSFGRDPRLTYTFKSAGRYYLKVRDTLYRGGPAFTYRLTLGRLPVVTRWAPMGVPRGSTVAVALQGVNLGTASSLQVKLPEGTGERGVPTVARTPLGPSLPILLYAESRPELVEKEPDDDAKGPMRAPQFPLVASGWMDKRGDHDVYAFTVQAKQSVMAEVQARRIGSRLDPILRITDTTGKELARNDDAVGKDARVTFTAPATGEYYAEVFGLTPQYGDDFFYRLRVDNPPAPDFALHVSPDNPTVLSGGATAVTVTAVRSGYAGEIPVRVEGLPPGVSASATVIPAGQNSVVFTLSAAAGTAPSGATIRVIGAAKIGETTLEHVASGQESYLPAQITDKAQAGQRETELTVAAVGPEAPYTVAVTALAAEVKTGSKLELTVKVTRTAAFKDPVALTVLGLPANVKASALTLKPDQAEGKITLEVAGNAPVGPAALVVQGSGKNITVAAVPTSVSVTPAK